MYPLRRHCSLLIHVSTETVPSVCAPWSSPVLIYGDSLSSLFMRHSILIHTFPSTSFSVWAHNLHCIDTLRWSCCFHLKCCELIYSSMYSSLRPQLSFSLSPPTKSPLYSYAVDTSFELELECLLRHGSHITGTLYPCK
jgi:hypothetical protein